MPNNEIYMPHTSSNATLRVQIVDVGDATKMWNGTTFVSFSSLSLAQWRTAVATVELVEQVLSGGTRTRWYTKAFPAGIAPGVYAGRVHSGAAPTPDGRYAVIMYWAWDGTNLISLRDVNIGVGTGAWAVTITVDDGTDALAGARVRMTSGGDSFQAVTDASGEAAFSLESATWTVAITKSGYTFTPTTLSVSADAAQTYSMTQVSIPASDPGQVTGYVYVYDENGDVEEGVTLRIQQKVVAEASGVAYDSELRKAVSNAAGLVSFTNLFAGGTYSLRRGTGKEVAVAIASGASSPYEMPSLLGRA